MNYKFAALLRTSSRRKAERGQGTLDAMRKVLIILVLLDDVIIRAAIVKGEIKQPLFVGTKLAQWILPGEL